MLAVVISGDFVLIISSLSVSTDSHPANVREAKGRNSAQVQAHLKSLLPSLSIKKVHGSLMMTKTCQGRDGVSR